MWPREFPEEYRADPLRRAERLVFENLREHLSSEFDAFWSRSWVQREQNQSIRDGECDFVVIHPDRGFCVLEVKGGTIRNNPLTTEWTSTGAGGGVHKIHDPFNQASASKHVLLDELLKILKKKNVDPIPWIPSFHGVLFPDVSKDHFEIQALKSPLSLIAFREDLGPSLSQWISELMHYSRDSAPFRNNAYPILKSYLEEHFSLPMTIEARIEEEETLMDNLTDQQEMVLESFMDQSRIRILGGAGTGKTLLAIKEVQRLVNAGCRTALICFNRGLSTYLQQQLSPLLRDKKQLHVSTLHSLLWEGIRRDRAEEYSLPSVEQVRCAIEQGRIMPFDAVIVDEGQDFVHRDWWTHVDMLLQGPKILRIFWDSNQKVYRGPLLLPEDISTNPVILTRILRNTQQIWKTAEPFYEGRAVTLMTPEGLPVQEVEEETFEKSFLRIRTLLKEWRAEGMSAKEIAVLFRDESLLTQARSYFRSSELPIVSCEERAPDSYTFDSIRRFKGLEARGVILVADPMVEKDPELMYVGITRARSRLGVIHVRTI